MTIGKNTPQTTTYADVEPKYPHRIFYEGVVTQVGADLNYPFRIRVRTSLDRGEKVKEGEEKLCDPFLPIFYNIIPNKGDTVRIVYPYGPGQSKKRLWIGPIRSHPKYYKQESPTTVFNLDLPDQNRSTIVPVIEGEDINKSKGIFANYFSHQKPTPPYDLIDFNESSLDGKDNTDILFRKQRVTLRAGKFKIGKPLVINDTNPAYIDLFLDDDGNKSHINIVANKINLVGIGGDPVINPPPLINTERWQKIIEGEFELPPIPMSYQPGLQSLVYGEKLVEFLELLKTYVRGHKHDYHAQPCRKGGDAHNDGGTDKLLSFEFPKILSPNVKTN